MAAAAAAAASSRRPAWNVTSNGAPIEVGPVMGADSWPALAEAAKASPKSVSSDSLKSLSDSSGSLYSDATQGPLVPSSPSPKQTNIVLDPNNTMSPARPKWMKHGGGSNGPPNGGVSPESSPKGSKSDGPHGGGDQHRGYSGNNRRGNNGGGSTRHDHEWNNHHRNAHMQHQQHRGGIRSYPRPTSLAASPFVAHPSHARPFVGNAMGFRDLPSTLYFVPPQPFIPSPVPPAMFLPAMDPQRAQLLKQIDYYFSTENLCRDLYLRDKMDDQGWVPVSLIAGFKKVKELTNNIQYILDTLQFSTLVEVQGDKMRRRNDWMNWLLHPSNHSISISSPQSLTTSSYDALTTRLQNVGLEGVTTTNHNMRGPIQADVVLTRSASGNLNDQFEVVGNPVSEVSGQFTGYTDSNCSFFSKTLSRSDTL